MPLPWLTYQGVCDAGIYKAKTMAGNLGIWLAALRAVVDDNAAQYFAGC